LKKFKKQKIQKKELTKLFKKLYDRDIPDDLRQYQINIAFGKKPKTKCKCKVPGTCRLKKFLGINIDDQTKRTTRQQKIQRNVRNVKKGYESDDNIFMNDIRITRKKSYHNDGYNSDPPSYHESLQDQRINMRIREGQKLESRNAKIQRLRNKANRQ